MDTQFERLGAERFFRRYDVDLEDWNVITKWTDGVFGLLPKLPLEARDETDYLFEKGKQTTEKKNSFDRKRPLYSKLKVKRTLTSQKDDEDKETIHFDFDLAESGIKYIVGDSLGKFHFVFNFRNFASKLSR